MSDALRCRCYRLPGIYNDVPCQAEATQEDGLCDSCRCEHGTCGDHASEKDNAACLVKRHRAFKAAKEALYGS